MSDRVAEATSLSDGWLGAAALVLAAPDRQVTHLVVRMTAPLPERQEVRQAVDQLVAADAALQEIDEVRNTIFPVALAEDTSGPEELAEVYLEDYDVLRRFASNSRGTYFGRICQYPHPDTSTTPQLLNLTKKLRDARDGQRFRARYQVNIYAEHKDAEARMGFPCMAHLSFQLGGPERNRLDCLALYRAQDMLRKGYGNFLGLAELQAYLAFHTGFEAGELTVIAGNAVMEGRITELRRLVDRLA